LKVIRLNGSLHVVRTEAYSRTPGAERDEREEILGMSGTKRASYSIDYVVDAWDLNGNVGFLT
jgi:hypothetical protein